MATVSSTNATSSLDVASVVKSLMVIENKPLDLIKVNISKQNLIISDLSTVKSKVSVLQQALNAFEDINTYNTISATSTNASQISVSASNGATLGSYDIQVTQTAEPTKINIGGKNTLNNLANVTVNATGFQISVGGVTNTYAAGNASTKLSDLNSWINGLGSSVTSNIIAVDSTTWNLSIQALKSGVSNAISVSNLNGGSATDNGNGTGSTRWSNGITQTFGTSGIKYSSGVTQTNNLSFSTAINSSAPDILLSQNGISTSIGKYTFSSGTNSTITLTNESGLSQTIPVANPVEGVNTLNFTNLGILVNYTTSATPGDTAAKIIADFTGKNISVAPPLASNNDLSLDLNMAAMDSKINVNGITYTRSSNSINDIIKNVTINLLGNTNNLKTSLQSKINIGKGTDNSGTVIQGLISAYNDTVSLYNSLIKNKSSTQSAGNLSTEQSLLSYIRSFKSSFSLGVRLTNGTKMSFSEIGIDLQLDGTAKFNAIKYATASGQGLQDKLALGAKVGYVSSTEDLSKNITNVLKTGGTIATQVESKTLGLAGLQKRQSNLENKLILVQQRYTEQYSRLNKLLYELDTQSKSLTSSLTALTNMNAGK
jgi:flagellar hook-associated protein 2